MIKFGIYTSFYNCEKFVDSAFSQIENLNYENFEWHITDDFSNDNTKELVLQRLKKSPIKNKIHYYEQKLKKEMYWAPNEFFDESFDWIVLVDVDDEIDPNCLQIYNHLIKDEDITLISSDFHKYNYENNTLHSISYILNDEPITQKIKRYHPSCDYLNNINYSCFGHLRAFRNLPEIHFEVKNRLAGAEDSYHIFWCNSYGKYLHIPRSLYKWNLHNESESHRPDIIPDFNGNFDIALNKLKQCDYGVNTQYNDIYIETCALGSYDFGKISENSVSLWTRELTNEQKQKLTNLYFDCNLKFNDTDAQIHIVCLNYFSQNGLNRILDNYNNESMLFYYQNQKKHFDNTEKDTELNEKFDYYLNTIQQRISGFSWWKYIRHFIIRK
jgi:glycosyltransferase involved in cell wall biosynthesis